MAMRGLLRRATKRATSSLLIAPQRTFSRITSPNPSQVSNQIFQPINHTPSPNHPSIFTIHRSYYVDRYGVRHFKQQGPSSWGRVPQLSQKTAVFLGVVAALGTVVYYTHLEVVPYTNRKHLVLISPQVEAKLGEVSFNSMKEQFKNRILPPHHPAVVRVSRIAEDSIKSAMEGVHASGDVQLDYTPDVSPHHAGSRDVEFLLRPDDKILTKQELYSKKENPIDDVWIENSRREGLVKGRKPQTRHVDHFKWEIVVVDAPVLNAACLPGGKIIVFTGLLKAFTKDDEIATILGHEIGHAIARHSGEMLTRSVFIGFFELLFLAVVQVPGVVGPASDLLLRLPFSRKMEMEADHIGVLVMAASGYDPRAAPGVYLKLGQVQKVPEFAQYMSTHPSGKTRAEGLLKSQTLREAIRIYESKRGGWDSMGFLM